MVVVLCAAGNLSTLIDRRNGKRKTEMSLGLMFNFFPLPSDEALLRLLLLFLRLLLLLLLDVPGKLNTRRGAAEGGGITLWGRCCNGDGAEAD